MGPGCLRYGANASRKAKAMDPSLIVTVVLGAFVGGFISGFAGFGFALVTARGFKRAVLTLLPIPFSQEISGASLRR